MGCVRASCVPSRGAQLGAVGQVTIVRIPDRHHSHQQTSAPTSSSLTDMISSSSLASPSFATSASIVPAVARQEQTYASHERLAPANSRSEPSQSHTAGAVKHIADTHTVMHVKTLPGTQALHRVSKHMRGRHAVSSTGRSMRCCREPHWTSRTGHTTLHFR